MIRALNLISDGDVQGTPMVEMSLDAWHQNIAVNSYIWIAADPAKHLLVESFN